jgi:hypothetical protein
MFPVVGMHEELELPGSTESRETDEDWTETFALPGRTSAVPETGHSHCLRSKDRAVLKELLSRPREAAPAVGLA